MSEFVIIAIGNVFALGWIGYMLAATSETYWGSLPYPRTCGWFISSIAGALIGSSAANLIMYWIT